MNQFVNKGAEMGEIKERIKESLAKNFIKRYESRLEYSENMRDEVMEILDNVHKSEWIFECDGEEYFAVEIAGYIKIRQKEELTSLYWQDFYELMYKVYWDKKEVEPTKEQAKKITYEEFRDTLGAELQKQAEGFVKIGYLLKIARDTDILHKSGYMNLVEFAKGEFKLTKDVVSRYIAINDRYSQNGYSECLKAEYKGYGMAKLAEMLTLPQEIVESIPVEATKREIQEIKREIREEERITDIEVALETPQKSEIELETLAEKAIYQQLKDNDSDFNGFFEATKTGVTQEAILDVLAPRGVTTILPRVPRIGKIMISIKGLDENIDFVNTRTMEKESITWEEMEEIVNKIFCNTAAVPDPAKAREIIFGEVAPVQPNTGEEKNEKADNYSNSKLQEHEKEEKTVIEETHSKIESKNSKKADKDTAEQGIEKIEKVKGEIVVEIPGQLDIRDYKEALPEGVKSNYEKFMERKDKIEKLATEIKNDVKEDNYAKLKWDAKKLNEIMEGIYNGE